MVSTPFTKQVGIEVPLICGAMYPCSNPELIAAVSEAGGIGIVQPLSLVYAQKRDLRDALKQIRSLTSKPIGFNALIEKSSQTYLDRMKQWIEIALEENIRFFITALGKPDWVVERVSKEGAVVYHDVTERKWAQIAKDGGVHGLICVNSRAGGHVGTKTPEQLMDTLGDLDLPLICAGGIGGPEEFAQVLSLGYAGAQLGTRFIATTECQTHTDYKQAIVDAKEKDIVHTDLISGVPVSVIKTPYVAKMGTKAGPIGRWLLRGRKTKHWMRLFYTLRSMKQLKEANARGGGYKDYYQAGMSVETIDEVLPAGDVVRQFAAALARSD
jgi:nitronate monooxygenase